MGFARNMRLRNLAPPPVFTFFPVEVGGLGGVGSDPGQLNRNVGNAHKES